MKDACPLEHVLHTSHLHTYTHTSLHDLHTSHRFLPMPIADNALPSTWKLMYTKDAIKSCISKIQRIGLGQRMVTHDVDYNILPY